jgi:hypothetical protein
MPDPIDAELRLIALALVDEAPEPPPFPDPAAEASRARVWPRRRLVAAGLVMVAAVGVAVAGVTLRNTSPDTSAVSAGPPLSMPSPDTAATTVPTAGDVCGSTPPRAIAVPEGFAGPVSGPIEGAPHTAGAGQLVLHWTSGAGGIELRWPPDPTLPNPPAAPATFSSTVLPAQAGANGQTVKYMMLGTGVATPEGCGTLQLGVFDPDGARVEAVMDALSRAPYVSTEPLVASSQSADVAPPVAGCRAPVGVTPPPNRSGEGDGVTYPSAAEALSAFIRSQPTVLPGGYVENRLPDGSLAYAVQAPGGAVVTVVHVVPTAGGWTVSRWQVSGC